MYNYFIFQRNKKVSLKEKGKTTIIAINKITHLTCSGYLTTLHSIDGKKHVIAKSLKKYESEYSRFGFLRINQNTIANMFHVKEIKGGLKREITLTNELNMKVSRRRYHSINKFFEKQ